MPTAALATLLIAALIIAITGVGLLRVVLHLRHVSATLTALTGGIEAIVASTSTVPRVLPSVNAHLEPVRAFCERV
jgi:hypothetical protein